jgi:uncharacterized protein (DUF2236 family)
MQRPLSLHSAAILRLPQLETGRPGDGGLFGPGSSIWRIGRERVLLLGGSAALLLQIAHPLVAAGVADHSDFRTNPYERLTATLDATLRITFGDRRQARAAADQVAATHGRVKGVTSAALGSFVTGTPYDAADPELAMWVHATLVETALETYHRFVRPLSSVQRERYFEDAKQFAALFGVDEAFMPKTYGAFREYFASVAEGPDLAVGAETRILAWHVLNPPLPRALRGATAAVKLVASGLLPGRLRGEYGLAWGPRERFLLGALTRATRLSLPLAPSRLRFWPHYLTARRRAGVSQGGG